MGWITVLLASGPARKALGLLLTTLTVALFLPVSYTHLTLPTKRIV